MNDFDEFITLQVINYKSFEFQRLYFFMRIVIVSQYNGHGWRLIPFQYLLMALLYFYVVCMWISRLHPKKPLSILIVGKIFNKKIYEIPKFMNMPI